MKRIIKTISLLTATILIITTMLSPISAYAATESQLRDKVISVAENEVGYTGTSSYSKYGDWYGYQGGWCTTFVLWCFNQAGNSYNTKLYANIIPSGGNCNSMISWFSNKGRYHTAGSGYTPQRGDLVFFDWSGNGSSQHVGIVNYVSGSTVYTIEGNCSGKVKSRSYNTTGSKPYNNVSSIMGYGAPDFASVSNGASQTTKNNTTTTKKAAQTTTKKASTNSTAQNQTTKKQTTTTTTTTETTTTAAPLESLSINASTYSLQIGDTIKLNYSVEPSGTTAVVGYFCDDEGIIELDSGGDIRAIGTGTATVVVCANNELYSQCEFTVTESVAEVTTIAHETTRKIVGTTKSQVVTTQKNAQSVLTRMGINVNALLQNKQLYLIPAIIIVSTAFISLFTALVKKIKKRKIKESEE